MPTMTLIILGLGTRSAPLPLPSRLFAGHGLVLAILSCPRSLGSAITCFIVQLVTEMYASSDFDRSFFTTLALSALGNAFRRIPAAQHDCFPSLGHYLGGLAFSAPNQDETSTPRLSRSPWSGSQSALDLHEAGMSGSHYTPVQAETSPRLLVTAHPPGK